jgi:hypothetical protein
MLHIVSILMWIDRIKKSEHLLKQEKVFHISTISPIGNPSTTATKFVMPKTAATSVYDRRSLMPPGPGAMRICPGKQKSSLL